MIEVVAASKERLSGELLPETAQEFDRSMFFSTFAKFLRALCGQMSQSVCVSVSESVSRPRVDV